VTELSEGIRIFYEKLIQQLFSLAQGENAKKRRKCCLIDHISILSKLSCDNVVDFKTLPLFKVNVTACDLENSLIFDNEA